MGFPQPVRSGRVTRARLIRLLALAGVAAPVSAVIGAASARVAASHAPSPVSVAGLWRADYLAPGKVLIPFFLDLHAGTGETPIAGRVRMSWGFEPVRRSSVTADGFVLELGSAILPLKVEGRVTPGGLALRFHDPRSGPWSVTAHRITALPSPPARLPLPPLRDIGAITDAPTPPMGWNSFNGLNDKVDDKAVRETADALVGSGLRDAGYRYVVIDDTWASRGRDGRLTGNSKFPNMKALADYVHARGLKFGVYSAPGPTTCGEYPGSYGHEAADAKTFAAWGVDFLKYDWCSAGEIYKDGEMRAAFQKMGDALKASGRPILYSICQYGIGDVTRWGPMAGGSMWRTVADLQPNWLSLRKSVETHARVAADTRVGAWGDPDMLVAGLGKLSADENRSHLSWWALFAAPMMIGADARRLTPETLAILTNPELIAIDQDAGGKPGVRVAEGGVEVWRRELADGSVAIGLFNLGDGPVSYAPDWAVLAGGRPAPSMARDIWARSDVAADGRPVSIAPHGVALFRFAQTPGKR